MVLPRVSAAEYRQLLRDGDVPLQAVSKHGGVLIDHVAPTPVIGTAVHCNDRIRSELVPQLYADASTRFYEEDPFTHRFLGAFSHWLVPNQSRFEVDMNRPPDQCVYRTPRMSWGIRTYMKELSREAQEKSMERWYEYHTFVDAVVEDAIKRFGRAYFFEFHSYNYQRDGPTDWRTDGKPVINLGTEHLDVNTDGRIQLAWVLEHLQAMTMNGEKMLVQENGVFMGGYLNRRLSRRYGPQCVTFSIELKKVFMNEQTGSVFPEILDDLALQMDQMVGRFSERVGAPVREPSKPPLLSYDE